MIVFGNACDGVQVERGRGYPAGRDWFWRHIGEGNGRWSKQGYPSRRVAVEAAREYWDYYQEYGLEA